MLSWSSDQQEVAADLDDLGAGGGGGVPHGDTLSRFAAATVGNDDTTLGDARAALVAATCEKFMIDAAAVAANFEMMTRVADGTGARIPGNALATRPAVSEAFGVAGIASQR